MSWKNIELPIIIVFICIVLVTVAYFVSVPILSNVSESIQLWSVIIAGFAIGLGIVNMIIVHGRYITRQVSGQWPYSIVFFLFFAAQAVSGLADIKTLSNPVYLWLSKNIYSPLGAAFYAILGFFIISASYRTMKIRNLEAGVILITGVFVMLKNAPIGSLIWAGFPVLGTWVLDVATTAVQRAILIGTGIGIILLGLRILLGYERGYLGGD